MGRTKYVPTQKDLDKAWRWKKRKYTAAQIAAKLGITESKYSHSRAIWNKWFKQKSKESKHDEQVKRLTKQDTVADILLKKSQGTRRPNHNKNETKLEVSDIDLDVLKSYVLCGFSRDRISSLLGITRTTLWSYAKKFPSIQHVLDHARDEATMQVVTSMLKMTKDRMVKDTIYTAYLGEITTKKIKKYVPPSSNMIKYWMANAAGWTSEPKPDKENNKGLIIKMLDDMANHEDGVGPVD